MEKRLMISKTDYASIFMWRLTAVGHFGEDFSEIDVIGFLHSGFMHGTEVHVVLDGVLSNDDPLADEEGDEDQDDQDKEEPLDVVTPLEETEEQGQRCRRSLGRHQCMTRTSSNSPSDLGEAALAVTDFGLSGEGDVIRSH